MLKRVRILIINQLGFSRSEANGVIVLLFIVILSIVFSRAYSTKPVYSNSATNDLLALEEWHNEILLNLSSKKINDQIYNQEIVVNDRFFFDPNVATVEDFQRLGFSDAISSRIINFRLAGGQFTGKNDLYKIYGIDQGLVNTLEKYILIPEQTSTDKIIYTDSKDLSVRKMDFNLVDAENLQKIRGIGPKLSSRTIRYRNLLGGFYDFGQLKEVYGMPDSLISEFKKYYSIDIAAITKIEINSISIEKLEQHPYLSKNQARAIFNYRNIHGDFETMESIKNVKIISQEALEKIQPYLLIKK